ncbi:MAG: dephospho-CoA kinase [Planctomycetales bacterium]|nr:dephospho-CoA kinase [Planctomycetales bacterium]
MKVIGIVGGIASGKSVVADELANLGAVLVDADQMGHIVLTEPEVIEILSNRWGAKILDSNGGIVRAKVAEIVFHGSESAAELKFLESVSHPRIRAKIVCRLEELRAAGAMAAILDAPLLFKTGLDAFCDVILFVECPQNVRQERAIRRGWTEAQFQQREAAQLPVDQKRKRSHQVIDNSGSLDTTRRQIRQFWESAIR